MERRNRQIKEYLREREHKKRVERAREEENRRIQEMELKQRKELNRWGQVRE